MPKLTIHQVWIGDVLPAKEEGYVKRIKEAAEEAGIAYKLWSLKDITDSYSEEEPYFFFKRIFFRHPHPHMMKVAVDYYKWRILADTPEGEHALYLDISTQLKKDKLPEFNLPRKDITIGREPATALSFIHIQLPSAAEVVQKAIEEKINSYFDLSDPEFDYQLLNAYSPVQPDASARIDWEFISEQFTKEGVKVGAAVQKWYTKANENNTSSLFVRHALSVRKSKDDLEKLQKSIIDEYEATHETKRLKLCILMSSAGEYAETSLRTLNGMLKAQQLRQMQRATTFSQEIKSLQVLRYFVIDTQCDECTEDLLYIEDAEGVELKALKMYKAIAWTAKHIEPDYIFLCCDDTFINLPRLEDYCTLHRPGELKVVHSSDKNFDVQIGGGILLPAAAIRKLTVLKDRPNAGESFGAFINRIANELGLKLVSDQRLSYHKANFPTKKNRFITTHGVNPYDLLALYEENFL